jgi:copper homeostasis protein
VPILVEVCVDSIHDALAAQAGGADRIELNADLHLQGLTPTLDLQTSAAELSIPVITMIRPRTGDFTYQPDELKKMRADIDSVHAHRAAGIAVGLLTSDGRIDVPKCRELFEAAGDLEIVFHRAFDLTPEPHDALEQLIDLGVTRVLTSGQQPTAAAGAPLIASLIEQADGRIEILPGAGIGPDNALQLVRATRADQIHGSFHRKKSHSREMPKLLAEQRYADNKYTFDPERFTKTKEQLSQLPGA